MSVDNSPEKLFKENMKLEAAELKLEDKIRGLSKIAAESAKRIAELEARIEKDGETINNFSVENIRLQNDIKKLKATLKVCL